MSFPLIECRVDQVTVFHIERVECLFRTSTLAIHRKIYIFEASSRAVDNDINDLVEGSVAGCNDCDIIPIPIPSE